MLQDLIASLKHRDYWIFSTWFKFGLKHRKTALGQLWLVLGAGLFVSVLGFIFPKALNYPQDFYVIHLTIGFVIWTLFHGFITGGSTTFLRRRADILIGGVRLTDIVFSEMFQVFLKFAHQAILIFIMFAVVKRMPGPQSYLAFIGVILIVLNGIWLSIFLGMFAARYRDIGEVVDSIMRLGFFITPIIWINEGRAGGVLGAALVLNPLFHFLEIVRGPLMGHQVDPLNWIVVGVITVTGYCLAAILYRYQSHNVAYWV